MKNNYAIKIFWSEDDDCFVAVCDEFPGLSAFGNTREGALAESQIALDLFIETYKSDGIKLPQPQVAILETL